MPQSAPVTPAARRVAGAPISWGVCEVPGWGVQLAPDRVLGEMAGVGIGATELGPVGYLPSEPAAVRAMLDGHGLGLVGGFVPLVLHEPSIEPARALAHDAARAMANAGAEVFVAAVVMDERWSPPRPLQAAELARLTAGLGEIATLVRACGLEFALHPHAGTLVETAADVVHVLASTDVGWCLDTGHLLIGGVDPVAFARDHGARVVHVHLKDVDARVAARYRSGELTLMQATRAGLFRPLGDGDAGIAAVLERLDAAGYDGWLVLEQDATLDEIPPRGAGPLHDVRRSLAFLGQVGSRRG